MKSLFVPLHITGISVNSVEMAPDENRLVSVPETHVDDLKGAGLLDPDDDAAMQAYFDALPKEAEEKADAPKAKPAFKRTAKAKV